MIKKISSFVLVVAVGLMASFTTINVFGQIHHVGHEFCKGLFRGLNQLPRDSELFIESNSLTKIESVVYSACVFMKQNFYPHPRLMDTTADVRENEDTQAICRRFSYHFGNSYMSKKEKRFGTKKSIESIFNQEMQAHQTPVCEAFKADFMKMFPLNGQANNKQDFDSNILKMEDTLVALKNLFYQPTNGRRNTVG